MLCMVTSEHVCLSHNLGGHSSDVHCSTRSFRSLERTSLVSHHSLPCSTTTIPQYLDSHSCRSLYNTLAHSIVSCLRNTRSWEETALCTTYIPGPFSSSPHPFCTSKTEALQRERVLCIVEDQWVPFTVQKFRTSFPNSVSDELWICCSAFGILYPIKNTYLSNEGIRIAEPLPTGNRDRCQEIPHPRRQSTFLNIFLSLHFQ